jgi:hypothetical protein
MEKFYREENSFQESMKGMLYAFPVKFFCLYIKETEMMGGGKSHGGRVLFYPAWISCFEDLFAVTIFFTSR